MRVKYIEKLLSKNSCSEEKRTAVSIGNTGEEIAGKTIKKKGYKGMSLADPEPEVSELVLD